MKKALALLMVAAMALGLVACGSSEKPAEAPAESAAPAAPAESAKPAESQAPAADSTGEKQSYKIGVSIMELTAYTWYQGVICLLYTSRCV